MSDIAQETAAAKPAKARRARRKPVAQEEAFREEVGPTELYDPIIRTEIKRAAVWIGMTAFVVGLVWLAQPLLLIMGGLVLAAMFDGGARLLGRVLPIPRGIRLTIVVLAVFGFMYWTFVFTGSELAAQAASLQAIVETQIESIGNRIAAAGFNISAEDVKSFGTQILNSVGRVTAAVSSVVGTVTNMAMMLVLAIFIAAEPRMYERGVAWMLPLAEREHFYVTAAKMGSVLRRLMAGLGTRGDHRAELDQLLDAVRQGKARHLGLSRIETKAGSNGRAEQGVQHPFLTGAMDNDVRLVGFSTEAEVIYSVRHAPPSFLVTSEFHPAPPVEHREYVIDFEGRRLEFPLTDFYVMKLKTETVVPDGQARLLAVTGEKRAAALPDIPTFKELGYPEDKIEWKESPSAQRETLISNDQVKFIVATYSITDARKQKVDFAGPYLLTGQSLLVKSDNTDITGAESLQDNKKLCSVSGSTPAQRIKDKYPGVQLQQYDTYSACVEALRNGAIDAVTTDEVILAGFAAKTPGEFKIVGQPFSQERYGIGLKKDDSELRTKINDALAKMEADGAWKAAFDKNLGPAGLTAPAPPPIDRY